MRIKAIAPGAAIGALALALAVPAQAQTTSTGASADTWRMPYQRDWWGHAGISIGQGELSTDCGPSGQSCDLEDQHLRVYAGGRFNNTFGGEVAYLDFGDYNRGGGQTDAQGLNFSLLAGFPIGSNSSIFGKLGMGYTRTSVTAAPGSGIQTGNANGWGPSIGLGAQVGLTDNWALRADIDRYRFKLPEGRNTMDTFTVGVQYTFR